MYKIEKNNIGKYQTIRLINEKNNDCVEIVPEVGACMTRLQLLGKSVLDGLETEEGLTNFDWAKSGVLAPFPNRLLDGKYTWQGKNYQFPLNDGERNNALHGFILQAPFQIENSGADSDKAWLTCSHVYDGSHEFFPFSFMISLDFQLVQTGLEVQIKVVNNDEQGIPMGTGWHPYFSFGGKVDELSIQMPSTKKVPVNERLIPTGIREEFKEFAELKKIDDAILDNCFELEQTTGTAELILQNHSYQLRYWQEAGHGKFPFIQIFIPPHRDSIAIEPMTCNIDALNNGEGLMHLAPRQEMKAKCGISLHLIE